MKVVIWYKEEKICGWKGCYVSNSIHGIKYLNGANKDTVKGRKEAERLFIVRNGSDKVNFVHQ